MFYIIGNDEKTLLTFFQGNSKSGGKPQIIQFVPKLFSHISKWILDIMSYIFRKRSLLGKKNVYGEGIRKMAKQTWLIFIDLCKVKEFSHKRWCSRFFILFKVAAISYEATDSAKMWYSFMKIVKQIGNPIDLYQIL